MVSLMRATQGNPYEDTYKYTIYSEFRSWNLLDFPFHDKILLSLYFLSNLAFEAAISLDISLNQRKNSHKWPSPITLSFIVFS